MLKLGFEATLPAFLVPLIWNAIENDKKLSSISLFKKKMKKHFLDMY